MLRELVVFGTPISLQSKRRRQQWQERVSHAARDAVPDEDPYFEEVSVALVYFYFGDTDLDVDNIAKPILDAMCGIVFADGGWISELTVRKTQLDRKAGSHRVEIQDPTPLLAGALDRALADRLDMVYISVSSAPDHSRLP